MTKELEATRQECTIAKQQCEWKGDSLARTQHAMLEQAQHWRKRANNPEDSLNQSYVKIAFLEKSLTNLQDRYTTLELMYKQAMVTEGNPFHDSSGAALARRLALRERELELTTRRLEDLEISLEKKHTGERFFNVVQAAVATTQVVETKVLVELWEFLCTVCGIEITASMTSEEIDRVKKAVEKMSTQKNDLEARLRDTEELLKSSLKFFNHKNFKRTLK